MIVYKWGEEVGLPAEWGRHSRALLKSSTTRTPYVLSFSPSNRYIITPLPVKIFVAPAVPRTCVVTVRTHKHKHTHTHTHTHAPAVPRTTVVVVQGQLRTEDFILPRKQVGETHKRLRCHHEQTQTVLFLVRTKPKPRHRRRRARLGLEKEHFSVFRKKAAAEEEDGAVVQSLRDGVRDTGSWGRSTRFRLC